MWNYPGLATRSSVRTALSKDPEWLAFLAKERECNCGDAECPPIARSLLTNAISKHGWGWLPRRRGCGKLHRRSTLSGPQKAAARRPFDE